MLKGVIEVKASHSLSKRQINKSSIYNGKVAASKGIRCWKQSTSEAVRRQEIQFRKEVEQESGLKTAKAILFLS
jgi:hypothetical protein